MRLRFVYKRTHPFLEQLVLGTWAIQFREHPERFVEVIEDQSQGQVRQPKRARISRAVYSVIGLAVFSKCDTAHLECRLVNNSEYALLYELSRQTLPKLFGISVEM